QTRRIPLAGKAHRRGNGYGQRRADAFAGATQSQAASAALIVGLRSGSSGLRRFGLLELNSGVGKNELRPLPDISWLRTVASVALVIRRCYGRSLRRNFVAYMSKVRNVPSGGFWLSHVYWEV